MAKIESVVAKSGSLADELIGLVRDLRIGLRAQMEQTFPGIAFTARPAALLPRIKDAESFESAVKEVNCIPEDIKKAAEGLVGIIGTVRGEIIGITAGSANVDSKYQASDVSWGCEQITFYRREAQLYLQQIFGYASALQFAVQHTLWNVEFIHECPPDPCADPHGSTDYDALSLRGAWPKGQSVEGDTADATSRLKMAEDARRTAEQAAQASQAEWKAQADRTADAEARARRADEARFAAERALRETEAARAVQATRAEEAEARVKRAEEARYEAERNAREAEAQRDSAAKQLAELEKRRRAEQEQSSEEAGPGESGGGSEGTPGSSQQRASSRGKTRGPDAAS